MEQVVIVQIAVKADGKFGFVYAQNRPLLVLQALETAIDTIRAEAAAAENAEANGVQPATGELVNRLGNCRRNGA